MKNQSTILILLAAAAAAAYYFLFRKKGGSPATSAGSGGAAGAPIAPQLYTPVRTSVASSTPSTGNSLTNNLAQAGVSAAGNLANSLLKNLFGGGGGGGGSRGGGGAGGGSLVGANRSSNTSTGSNAPLTYTDPNTGVTYDAWTQQPISGGSIGNTTAYNPADLGNLGNPSGDVNSANDFAPVDLAPVSVGDTNTVDFGSELNPGAGLDTSGGNDLASVDLPDNGGDFGGG